MRPLFIPPGASPGESLTSILRRAATDNVFRDATAIVRLAGLRISRINFAPFTLADHSLQLAELLSLDEEEVRSRMHPLLNAEASHVDWYGMLIPRRYIDASTRRVAPRSLALQPFDRAAWMLRPLSFCPETFEHLISDCPKCGVALNWRVAPHPTSCPECGRSFPVNHSRVVPNDLRPDLQATCDLVSTNPSIRAQAQAALPQPFRDWPTGDVVEAIVEFALVMQNPLLRKSCGKIPKHVDYGTIQAKALADSYQLVATWPAKLGDLVISMVSANARSAGIQRPDMALGPLGKLTHKLSTNQTIRKLLTQELQNVILRPTIPVKHWTANNISRLLSGELLSGADVVKRTGVAFATLRKLEQKGECVALRKDIRRGNKLYDIQSLERSIAVYKVAVRPAEAAKRLGVPKFILPAIGEADLIKFVDDRDAITLSGSPFLFERHSFEKLVRQFSQYSPVNGTGGEPLIKCLFGVSLYPSAWVAAIKGILAGRIPVASTSLALGAVGRLRFDPVEFFEISETYSHNQICPDTSVPCIVAGSILGTTAVFVKDLVQTRRLVGQKLGRDFSIPLSAIADFQDKYVLAKEACHRIGAAWFLRGRSFDLLGFDRIPTPRGQLLIERRHFDAVLSRLHDAQAAKA